MAAGLRYLTGLLVSGHGWTRDLSYAASLGLALLDPQRTRNSLLFKLSGYRNGKPALAAGSEDGLQIGPERWCAVLHGSSVGRGADRLHNFRPSCAVVLYGLAELRHRFPMRCRARRRWN